jgi:hypothetical protein
VFARPLDLREESNAGFRPLRTVTDLLLSEGGGEDCTLGG